jgi:hypothetical protein
MPARPASAEEAARELADGLEARRIDYAIGGALALSRYAVPRGTIDVDLNLWVDPGKPADAARLMAELGCELKTGAAIRNFMDRGWAYATYRGVHVDAYLPTRDFHESVRARRVRLPLLGRPAWYLSAEDLAVFKLVIYRAKDLGDLEALLMAAGRSVDRAYVREWLARLTSPADVRLRTWDELSAAAEAALRRRDEGWKPPGEE